MSKPKIAEPEVRVDGLRVSTFMLLGGALILFIFSIFMWQKFIVGSDKRIFQDAIANALSAKGVVIVNDSSEAGITRTISMTLDLQGDLASETVSEYHDETSHSIIKTLSNKQNDFLYYEKNENSNQPRLKEFEGTWVNIGTEGQTESQTLADNLTNGTMVFVGNLSASDRKGFLRLLEKESVYNMDKVLGVRQFDGQELQVYRIKLNTIGFNVALKQYLSIVGLSEASSATTDSVNADSLQPTIEVAVNRSSRQIAMVGYPDLNALSTRQYKDWGSSHDFEFPSSSISAEELQQKLDSIYTPASN